MYLGLIYYSSLFVVGICLIIFAGKLSELAYSILKMFSKSGYAWLYRIFGAIAIYFSIDGFYSIFFS
jgi:hypothetical protein